MDTLLQLFIHLTHHNLLVTSCSTLSLSSTIVLVYVVRVVYVVYASLSENRQKQTGLHRRYSGLITLTISSLSLSLALPLLQWYVWSSSLGKPSIAP